jgi:hypothetical protein
MGTVGSDYRMPFGKFRGYPLDEIDDDYITWLYSLDDLRQPLRGWVEEEFQRRRRRDEEEFERHQQQTRERYGGNWGNKDRERPLAENGPPPERTTELIDAGFKSLARVHHPDVGGTDEGMRETLEARAWLLRQVNDARGARQ